MIRPATTDLASSAESDNSSRSASSSSSSSSQRYNLLPSCLCWWHGTTWEQSWCHGRTQTSSWRRVQDQGLGPSKANPSPGYWLWLGSQNPQSMPNSPHRGVTRTIWHNWWMNSSHSLGFWSQVIKGRFSTNQWWEGSHAWLPISEPYWNTDVCHAWHSPRHCFCSGSLKQVQF